jgi:hypothetical protein
MKHRDNFTFSFYMIASVVAGIGSENLPDMIKSFIATLSRLVAIVIKHTIITCCILTESGDLI